MKFEAFLFNFCVNLLGCFFNVFFKLCQVSRAVFYDQAFNFGAEVKKEVGGVIRVNGLAVFRFVFLFLLFGGLFVGPVEPGTG